MSSAMRRKRRAGDAPSTMRGRGGKRARGGAGTGAGGAGAGAGVNTSRQARRALDEEIDWAYESDDSSTDNAHNADSDGGSSGVSDDAGSGSESDGGGDVPETADERKLRCVPALLPYPLSRVVPHLFKPTPLCAQAGKTAARQDFVIRQRARGRFGR